MRSTFLLLVILPIFSPITEEPEPPMPGSKILFEVSGTEDWTKKWFLDGKRASVRNGPDGMLFEAGQEWKNDSCHAVLWTQEAFEGNILIEYDYTRTDTETRGVNILYFHATGQGDEAYPEDVYEWREKREVPVMAYYFLHMNAYHISYAAYNSTRYGAEDYIRLRRYDPSKKALRGSEILPDSFGRQRFQTGVTYHIEVSRIGDAITMSVTNSDDPSDQILLEWDAGEKPPTEQGRIGLRHMYTRGARYKDFKVWQLE